MAKRTRLGYEGYAVRRAGSFSKVVIVPPVPQVAKASVIDGVVSALVVRDGVVSALVVRDGVVIRVTLTEWPSS